MAFDLVVIGGGFAGLTAACRAAESGLKPVVLESSAETLYWCNSRIATGALHIASHSPREPAADLFAAIMDSTGGTARRDLAQAMADNASDTLDWLAGLGVTFGNHPRRMNGVPMVEPMRDFCAGLDWEGSGPNLLLQKLAATLVERGGEMRGGWRATRILREDGRVTGVVAEGPLGPETIRGAAVVVADGGFQANIDLVGRHITRAPEKLHQRNAGTGRGDGLRMATEIGAATIGLETFYGHTLSRDAMSGNPMLWPYPQVDVICAKGIVVDPAGKRFANEGYGGIFMANAIARLDDPLSATAVFDATVWEDARTTDNVPPNPSLPDNGGTVIEADDLTTLAQRAGIDPAGLAATVEAFNAGTANLQPPRTTATYRAHPLKEPPFYAIPLCAGITVTSGGLAIDGRAQVLDDSEKPIPGLYAAGSAVGGIEGGPAAGYAGGLMKALCFGLIAGRSVGEQVAGA